MTTKKPNTQAPRNEMVGVAVTADEKRAVRTVASALGLTDSELLRNRTIADVLVQNEKILAAVAEPALVGEGDES